MSKKFTDIIVAVNDPAALDATIQHFGACVNQNSDGSYVRENGGYRVRCFGDVEYLKFAIKNQGYGQIIPSADDLERAVDRISSRDD